MKKKLILDRTVNTNTEVTMSDVDREALAKAIRRLQEAATGAGLRVSEAVHEFGEAIGKFGDSLINRHVLCEDEWGVLHQHPYGFFRFVEVKNSTPEPDGSLKTYYLRVPPWIATPREGIAWTMNIDDAEEYNPEKET